MEEEEEEEISHRRLEGEFVVQMNGSGAVHYPIYSGENAIGRLDTNDVCVLDATVSSKHLIVSIIGDSAWVTDLGSTNRTRFVRSFEKLTGSDVVRLEPNCKVRQLH
jgi:hypothetical protein